MNNLEIVFNDNTHTWELGLENAIKKCEKFIEEREKSEVVIEDDITWKELKDNRTEINNKLKEIKNTRIQACRSVTGEFERSCKELEKLLLEAGNRMTERIEAYKPRKKQEKAFVLTISTFDLKAYEKVKSYAKKYACEVKEEK